MLLYTQISKKQLIQVTNTKHFKLWSKHGVKPTWLPSLYEESENQRQLEQPNAPHGALDHIP